MLGLHLKGSFCPEVKGGGWKITRLVMGGGGNNMNGFQKLGYVLHGGRGL